LRTHTAAGLRGHDWAAVADVDRRLAIGCVAEQGGAGGMFLPGLVPFFWTTQQLTYYFIRLAFVVESSPWQLFGLWTQFKLSQTLLLLPTRSTGPTPLIFVGRGTLPRRQNRHRHGIMPRDRMYMLYRWNRPIISINQILYRKGRVA